MPYFTVVIPLYNKQNFVADAISSVLSQTFADFELLVVNDASTDDSLSKVSKITDRRLRVLTHEVNKGLSAARNTGWQNAAAGLIAFLDADDWWREDFLETIATLIDRFPSAGLYATRYEEQYKNRFVPIKLNLKSREAMLLVDDYFETAMFQPPYWFGSAVVRREVFENVGGFDPEITFGEDTDFNIRANLKFQLAYAVKSCSVYRMTSENQITQSNFSQKKITDFNKYELANAGNCSLKKFLDANRYFLAMRYRIDGNTAKFGQLKSEIDFKNLNQKQQLLISCPVFLLKTLRAVKQMLLLSGKRVTSFGG